MDDGEGDSGWELNSMTAEIYRGEMNAAGDIGTGLGYYSDDDTDYSVGTRFYSATDTDISAIGLTGTYPVTISENNISLWNDILSSSDVKQLDSNNTGSEGGFWEIFYKMDSDLIPVRLSDDTPNINENSISGYITAFTPVDRNPGLDLPETEDEEAYFDVGREDLSTWGNISLVVTAMQ